METVRHASQKCTKPVFPSCMSVVGAAHCGALAVSFACSFEAAIWASLPASVAVFVCPGVVGGEDSGRKHFLIARTKRRWLTERPRLPGCLWSLTTDLVVALKSITTLRPSGLPADGGHLQTVNQGREGVWMMWGGWAGEEGCQQGWNNMITHLVSSWYLCAATPPANAEDFISQITKQVTLKMANYGKPVSVFFPLNRTLFPKNQGKTVLILVCFCEIFRITLWCSHNTQPNLHEVTNKWIPDEAK